MRIVIYPRAQSDIDGIWDYSAENWNAEQAHRYVGEIRKAIEIVAGDPSRGRAVGDVRKGYFKFAVGSHFLFYLIKPSRVEVVRVLHQRMDFTRHI